MTAVEPFPLVPAIWIEGRAFCGWPAASAKLNMRSRPNLLDRFRREHSQSVTVSILCKSGAGGMAGKFKMRIWADTRLGGVELRFLAFHDGVQFYQSSRVRVKIPRFGSPLADLVV